MCFDSLWGHMHRTQIPKHSIGINTQLEKKWNGQVFWQFMRTCAPHSNTETLNWDKHSVVEKSQTSANDVFWQFMRKCVPHSKAALKRDQVYLDICESQRFTVIFRGCQMRYIPVYEDMRFTVIFEGFQMKYIPVYEDMCTQLKWDGLEFIGTFVGLQLRLQIWVFAKEKSEMRDIWPDPSVVRWDESQNLKLVKWHQHQSIRYYLR